MSIMDTLRQRRVKIPHFVSRAEDLDDVPAKEDIVVTGSSVHVLSEAQYAKMATKNAKQTVHGTEFTIDEDSFIRLPPRAAKASQIRGLMSRSVTAEVLVKKDLIIALRKRPYFFALDGYIRYGAEAGQALILLTGDIHPDESQLQRWTFRDGEFESVSTMRLSGTSAPNFNYRLMEAAHQLMVDVSSERKEICGSISGYFDQEMLSSLGVRDIGFDAIKKAPSKPFRLSRGGNNTARRRMIMAVSFCVVSFLVWGGVVGAGMFRLKQARAEYTKKAEYYRISTVYSASLLDGLELERRYLNRPKVEAKRVAQLISTIEAFSSLKGIKINSVEYIGTNSTDYKRAMANPKQGLGYDFSLQFSVPADRAVSSREQLRGLLKQVYNLSPVSNLFSLTRYTSNDGQSRDRRRYRVGGKFCHACSVPVGGGS